MFCKGDDSFQFWRLKDDSLEFGFQFNIGLSFTSWLGITYISFLIPLRCYITNTSPWAQHTGCQESSLLLLGGWWQKLTGMSHVSQLGSQQVVPWPAPPTEHTHCIGHQAWANKHSMTEVRCDEALWEVKAEQPCHRAQSKLKTCSGEGVLYHSV